MKYEHFLSGDIIPDYATAAARDVCQPLVPWQLRHGWFFGLESGHCLGTTIRSVSGQASPSLVGELINLSCFPALPQR